MEEKEIYVYLDINGKLDQSFFQKQDLFFKIVNLHKKHPLIQIGNYIFEVEDENPRSNENAFVKQTPIHLKYLCKTAKTLQLKWTKIPSEVAELEPTELLDLQFHEDYAVILRKLERGQLKLEDVVHKSKPNESGALTNGTLVSQENVETVAKNPARTVKEVRFEGEPPEKYKILKALAKKPKVQRNEFQKVFKVESSHLKSVNDVEDFAAFKQLFFQSLCTDRLSLDLDEERFEQYVDVEKSVRDGIISTPDSDCLSEEQKTALLSSGNFDNFSVPMKLTYLMEQLKEYKTMLESSGVDELSAVDKYGRTLKDRYRLLKRLTKDVWFHVYKHCV